VPAAVGGRSRRSAGSGCRHGGSRAPAGTHQVFVCMFCCSCDRLTIIRPSAGSELDCALPAGLRNTVITTSAAASNTCRVARVSGWKGVCVWGGGASLCFFRSVIPGNTSPQHLNCQI
jgi:hypothetical protein